LLKKQRATQENGNRDNLLLGLQHRHQIAPEGIGRDESKGKKMKFQRSHKALIKNMHGASKMNRKKIIQKRTQNWRYDLRDSPRREIGYILSGKKKKKADGGEETNISYRKILNDICWYSSFQKDNLNS
jgi:hypothetical protein